MSRDTCQLAPLAWTAPFKRLPQSSSIARGAMPAMIHLQFVKAILFAFVVMTSIRSATIVPVPHWVGTLIA